MPKSADKRRADVFARMETLICGRRGAQGCRHWLARGLAAGKIRRRGFVFRGQTKPIRGPRGSGELWRAWLPRLLEGRGLRWQLKHLPDFH